MKIPQTPRRVLKKLSNKAGMFICFYVIDMKMDATAKPI